MPQEYLIIRPVRGSKPAMTEVVYYNSDRQSRDVMFTGGRWQARKFLADLRVSLGWENVPAYCEKKARRGFPPAMVLIA